MFYKIRLADFAIVAGPSPAPIDTDEGHAWWPVHRVCPPVPVGSIARDVFVPAVDPGHGRVVETQVVEPMTYADCLAVCHAARRAAYPPIGDQLDAIMRGFEALAAGEPLPPEVAVWVAACQAVKDAHPKPEAPTP